MERQKSFENPEMGKLYLVPTPIGNLEDITFRAIRILQEVSLILAEDTRHTKKLLNHFDIDTPQLSFHEHNSHQRIPGLVVDLLAGQSMAQVSDAGTPSISDPGFELVQACIEAGIPVVPLPGANAAISALIASGLVPQPFYFFGFLPRRKKERIEQLEALKSRSETVILYESPYRLKECFSQIAQVYGEHQTVVLSRELTKKHEEFIRGSAKEIMELLEEETLKGECCILIGSKSKGEQLVNNLTEEDHAETSEMAVVDLVDYLQTNQGLSQKDAIKKAAKTRQMRKQDVYRLVHQEEQPENINVEDGEA